MIETICQVGIAVFGLSAIFLVARKNKWGFVLGLISQPFYFVTAYQNNQWGILTTWVFYTVNWIYGIYNWFVKEKEVK